MENLLEQLIKRRTEFVSIRDKADGAIQAMDIVINDLRRANEPKKEEEEGDSEPEPGTIESNGNGHAIETA